ncbi:MAG: type IV pilus assembly protein PilM [Patescibacteria group bacterium]
MSFFSSWGRKKSYLGVDIGTASIKMVELEAGANRTPRLVTYGRAENTKDFTKVDSEQDIGRIVATIKEVAKRANIKAKRTVSALPTFVVFSSVISLPAMSQKELGSAVAWEARKFVPLPINEMTLDWKILNDEQGDKADTNSNNIRVLLTAAPQNVVKRYLDIFRRAGLDLLSLETEAFALERSLLGGAKTNVMIVDLGAVGTDICVIEQGIPILNRSIDVGGFTLTKAIARSLNIDIKRAEQFKRDIGLNISSGGSGSIPQTIETSIGPIINEIKYTFNLYQGQSPHGIEKIILTGGSSFLPHLTDYLESIFQLRVYIGDPWARISYPLDMKPILDEIGPQFSSAIGLAMREII